MTSKTKLNQKIQSLEAEIDKINDDFNEKTGEVLGGFKVMNFDISMWVDSLEPLLQEKNKRSPKMQELISSSVKSTTKLIKSLNL